MASRFAVVLIAMGAVFSTPANACSLIGPSVTETVAKVANGGLLISGQVIQAFDADKDQPEIIRADQICRRGWSERFPHIPLSIFLRTLEKAT